MDSVLQEVCPFDVNAAKVFAVVGKVENNSYLLKHFLTLDIIL